MNDITTKTEWLTCEELVNYYGGLLSEWDNQQALRACKEAGCAEEFMKKLIPRK